MTATIAEHLCLARGVHGTPACVCTAPAPIIAKEIDVNLLATGPTCARDGCRHHHDTHTPLDASPWLGGCEMEECDCEGFDDGVDEWGRLRLTGDAR